jgi:hypothetical protein
MRKFLIFAGYALFCILLSNAALAQKQAYTIGISLKGISDTTIILGHYLGKSMYPDDTASVDESGKGEFKGKGKLVQGLYVVYMPSGKYFEFIMGEPQHFSLSADTADFVASLKSEDSDDNALFFDFQRYMLSKRGEMEGFQKEITEAKNEKDKKKLTDKIQELNKERIQKINQIATENPGLFVSTFLKATLDVEVPEELKDNQQKSYTYFKTHYFDNFDLSDIRLLHTPLYEEKIKNYLDNIVLQIPDSLNKEIDMIIEKTKSDSSLFRFALITLFNKYAKSQIMGMDAVQVHIADKYYINEAWWSDEKFKADLKERVEVLKPLLIGKIAPDVELMFVPTQHFIAAENDTALKRYPHVGIKKKISDVEADYTVLIFWEATCSHCKVAVPEMYKIYEDSLKTMNVQVLAISTLFGSDGKEKWIDFVNKNKLYDWINAWNPYDYKFKVQYDVRSTPQIYVLNKNKEIIGKKLAPENVVGLINAYKKYTKKE